MAPSIKENANSAESHEEKKMIGASNCEDNTLATAAAMNASEEKLLMTCANNCEDNTFPMEVDHAHSHHDDVVASNGKNNEDVEVEILDNVIPSEEIRVAERQSLDVTESSSSFGYTDSEAENAADSSDMEVESQVRDDNASLLRFDGFDDLFRTKKKRLTAHWRKFIRPLMWRCKWLELHIRELHSQASKYDKELAEYGRRKQHGLEKHATGDLGMKSAPSVCHNQPVKLMKRKKRKRVEETDDLASYTSHHTLYSYYASRRPIVDSAHLEDDHSNTDVLLAEKTPLGSDEFGVNARLSALEFKDSDAFEGILRMIEEAQLKVRQLRVRMDRVVRENAVKFTSGNSCIAPPDPLASRAPISVLTHVKGEKIPSGSMVTTSQQTSEKILIMPESAVSGPDMIESTDQPQIGEKCEKMEHGIVSCDRPVKKEVNNTGEAGIQCTRAEPKLASEGKARSAQHVGDPNSTGKMVTREHPTTLKARSMSKLATSKTSKMKRKRGRPKVSRGRWNRRSSG